MSEMPRVANLGDEYREHPGRMAAQVGLEAVEQELRGEAEKVEISLYVRGRVIATTTDSDTLMRIMALLTGVGG